MTLLVVLHAQVEAHAPYEHVERGQTSTLEGRIMIGERAVATRNRA